MAKQPSGRNDFLYDVATKRAEYIENTFGSHISKLNILFATSGIVTTLIIPTLMKQGIWCLLTSFSGVVSLIGLFFLLSSIFYAYRAMKMDTLYDAPDPNYLASDEMNKVTDENLKKKAIEKITEAYFENRKTLQKIGNDINISLLLLFIGICIIVSSIFVPLLTNGTRFQ